MSLTGLVVLFVLGWLLNGSGLVMAVIFRLPGVPAGDILRQGIGIYGKLEKYVVPNRARLIYCAGFTGVFLKVSTLFCMVFVGWLNSQ